MLEVLVFILLLMIPVVALGVVTYLYYLEKERNRKIMEKIDKIDLKSVEDKILKILEGENKYFAKTFELEMLLENYRKATLIIGEKVENLEKQFKEIEKLPKDYERTYRDVVRRVLDLDNKFTDRFKMLAEAVLKLKEEKNS